MISFAERKEREGERRRERGEIKPYVYMCTLCVCDGFEILLQIIAADSNVYWQIVLHHHAYVVNCTERERERERE